MKNLNFFVLLLTFTLNNVQGQTPNAWINEFHYDNIGGDVNEFIEIAIVDTAAFSPDNFFVYLYNGSDGTLYDPPYSLSGFTPGNETNNITLFYEFITGIQNGAPDGIALTYEDADTIVIQFLSYEGNFTATEGPADGLESIDIEVNETTSTPIGSSLGLCGEGTQYSDFTWTLFSDDTPGEINNDQALPVELINFTACTVNNSIQLSWTTIQELNNFGFEIEKSTDGKFWDKIGFVPGNGNSNSPKTYRYTDESTLTSDINFVQVHISGIYFYRLKQIDYDGRFKYSDVIQVDFDLPGKFNLSQNFPNPFNPTTNIRFSVPVLTPVSLIVYNVMGEEISELLNDTLPAGEYQLAYTAPGCATGIYYYVLKANNQTEVGKMLFLK